MQVRSLTGTMCRQAVLSCLGAATWLCAIAPLPVAAQQKGEAESSAEMRAARKQPPTVVATPPFTVGMAQLAGCFVVNIASTPQEVTTTKRTENGLTKSTETLQPNDPGGVEGSAGGQISCEFQASDVTLIRAGAIVTEASSNHPTLQIIPAN